MSNATDNDYVKYAAAGELFGRLRDCLGFGELAMFTRSFNAIAYQWTFKAGSNRYCQEFHVTFEALESCPSQSLAFVIADEWKQQHREKKND